MSVQEIYEAACFQDIGGRKEQQDRVEILWSNTACLVVLADGMGGHMRGAFAAQTAVDVARKVFGSAVQAPVADLFESIVATANDHINSKAKMFNCPATTCVLLHLTPLKASWTHLGDSRLYRFQDGRFFARTADHNNMELARKQGDLSEDEIQAHPQKHDMYACLGAWMSPSIEIQSADLSESDGFRLCSDGLSDNVSDQDMEAVFDARDFPAALRELVAMARSRGGANCDNISVAAVRAIRLAR